MNAALIVVAAGRSFRMGKQVNKLYLDLNGKPLLYHTLSACLAAGCFGQFIIVVSPGEEELFRREILLPCFQGFNPVIAAGGSERQDSVFNGLRVVDPLCRIVCVHDGARPLVSPLLFERVLQDAARKGAALAAVPVKDTVKRVDADGVVLETPARNSLWLAQTPQAFRRDWLLDACQRAAAEKWYATDDAALLERYGYAVQVVEGDYRNLKITTPEDLVLAGALLKEAEK
jgi:2-C-methyl-D-erythritol 4-phosphate cytidylyltransferase